MSAAEPAPVAAEAEPSMPGGRAQLRAPRLGAGWRVVAAKELGDHLLSARFIVLLAILGLAAATTVYAAAAALRDVAPDTSGVPALFLRVFTESPGSLGADSQVPAFYGLIGFLAPLLGIAFGFDAVNGERAGGTLPRLLSQPIYRDDVINGKFTAGLAVIALILVAMTGLVAGLALIRLGVVPSVAEVARIVAWLLVSIIYVGFWLAFATLCSVALRRAATSALVAIGVWLAVTLFAALFVSIIAGVVAPNPSDATSSELIANAQAQEFISRLSPSTLYQEATIALLNPSVRSIGLVLPVQADRAIPSSLPLDQSLLLVWPQIVALVALTVLSFAAAYVLFLRQEVRA